MFMTEKGAGWENAMTWDRLAVIRAPAPNLRRDRRAVRSAGLSDDAEEVGNVRPSPPQAKKFVGIKNFIIQLYVIITMYYVLNSTPSSATTETPLYLAWGNASPPRREASLPFSST